MRQPGHGHLNPGCSHKRRQSPRRFRSEWKDESRCGSGGPQDSAPPHVRHQRISSAHQGTGSHHATGWRKRRVSRSFAFGCELRRPRRIKRGESAVTARAIAPNNMFILRRGMGRHAGLEGKSLRGSATMRQAASLNNARKLKTPETEASGVSILTISQYSRCCILRLPQRPTLQLSLAVASSWLRRLENPRLSSAVLHSGSTGGQLPGSDRRCIGRLDRLRTSGLRRLFRSSVRPVAIPFDSRRTILPPARPTINLRLASTPSFGSAGSTSGFRRLLLLPPGWLRPRFSPAVSPSGFTGCESFNFR